MDGRYRVVMLLSAKRSGSGLAGRRSNMSEPQDAASESMSKGEVKWRS